MIDNHETTVLVTGGAGFIGSHVVRDLLAKGERVIAYDLLPSGNALQEIISALPSDGRLQLERGSVVDGWRLERLCRQWAVDRIVHLASPLTQDVTEDPLGGVRDICEGTAMIFEVASACGVRRVVWASSVAVFGARQDYPAGPIANDAPHRPASLYGCCKSLCEQMARTYREERGVDSIGVRLAVVYGPARLRGYMSFPSHMIRSVALGQAVQVPIARQNVNWQYVEDVAGLITHCLQAPRPVDVAFNTWGDVRPFGDVGHILQRLAPEVEIAFSDDPLDDGHRALLGAPAEFDDSDLRSQIGYVPRFTLEQGVGDAFSVFQSQAQDGGVPNLT